MVREVDLVSYLPHFVARYQETSTTLIAENPEFQAVWKAADRVLYNEFLATADEYGISRFEKLLGILPLSGDTLEARRLRVQSKWFLALPYTWRMLLQKLTILCHGEFEVSVPTLGGYEIAIKIVLGPHTRTLLFDVLQLLEGFLPANLYYEVTGISEQIRTKGIYVGAYTNQVCQSEIVGDGYEVNRTVEHKMVTGACSEHLVKPETIRDGYQINRRAGLGMDIGACMENLYKPERIRDGYQVKRSIRKELGVGTFGESTYRPEPITDGYCINRKLSPCIRFGMAIKSTYWNTAKQEESICHNDLTMQS